MKRGTATVSAGELRDAIVADHDTTTENCVAGGSAAGPAIVILTEDALLDAVARDRAAGRSIAFANGCFDLLHVGHVRYLQGAAGGRSCSSSRSTTIDRSCGLKGPGRPILPAADRAELVAALRGVDYVIVFADATVERLLTLIKPDVHCKGTDYTPGHGARARRRQGYGGRMAIVGDPKMHATRDLIGRVRAEEPRQPGRRRRTWRVARATDPHRPSRRARRHRPRHSGGGRAAARVSVRAHRLARQREASGHPRSGAGHRSPSRHQRSRQVRRRRIAVGPRSASCGASGTTWRSIFRA